MRAPYWMLRETITVEPYLGPGSRGPSYDVPVTMRAMFQWKKRLLTDPNGNAVSIDGIATIRPEDGPVAISSRVELNGVYYRVMESMPVPDSRRPRQYDLSLSRLEV